MIPLSEKWGASFYSLPESVATSDPGSDIMFWEATIVLFDLRPKKRKIDLFDRKQELEEVLSAFKKFPIILATGLRRVGKSSLIRVSIEESKCPSVSLDGRLLYMNAGGNIKKMHLVQRMERELANFSNAEKFVKSLKTLSGISLKGNSISFNWKELDVLSLIEKLENFAIKRKTHVILFFDEAQYFKHYGSRGGKDLLALFSYVYDNFEWVRIVLTGSEVGLLHDFLAVDDYDSPLYGRVLKEIRLQPFSKELSTLFLKRGFEETGVKPDFNFEKATNVLGGLPGYLIQFGIRYSETHNFDLAMEETLKTISGMIKGELEELDRKSRRYIKVLKYIAKGADTWSKIKNMLAMNGDTISDSRLYETLNNLEKMCWISKEKSEKILYKIADPVVRGVIGR